ncbi:hypothetical protein BKA70DRAFT_1230122 [Coprinopsis sp. MPI-PUGE-AT-0042]|nr:hypothetical protein BKA70DRAFT_1230122 [Coprinopsis sp. MPI-PUGE-AT-0042]
MRLTLAAAATSLVAFIGQVNAGPTSSRMVTARRWNGLREWDRARSNMIERFSVGLELNGIAALKNGIDPNTQNGMLRSRSTFHASLNSRIILYELASLPSEFEADLENNVYYEDFQYTAAVGLSAPTS